MKHILLPSSMFMALLPASMGLSIGFKLHAGGYTIRNHQAIHPSVINNNPFERRWSLASLRVTSISVVGKNMLWAVGREQLSSGIERALVLHSSNGGLAWGRQLVDSEHWFYDVFFLNSQTGWIAGYDGLVLKSTDGGESWTKQRTSTQAPLIEIHFIDGNIGWAVGEDGRVLRTTDGGTHWQTKRVSAKGSLRSLQFTDAVNGWVVGEEGQAYRSHDGGITWEPQESRLLQTIRNMRGQIAFRTVDFIDSRRGFIVASIVPKKEGEFPHKGVLFKTTNGGRSWSTLVVPGDSGLLHARFLSGAEMWVVDERGEKLLHTVDGGKHWMRVQPFSDGGSSIRVYFANTKLGWLVVSYGMYSDKILYTVDGGLTWAKGKLPGSDENSTSGN